MLLIDNDGNQIVVLGASAFGLFFATAWKLSGPIIGVIRMILLMRR